MKPQHQSNRPTSAGLVLFAILLLLSGSALMLWANAGGRHASANELAIQYNPYPILGSYLPLVAYQLPPTPVPPPTPTPIPPKPVLFLDERNEWDGEGYLRLEEYSEVGTHNDMEFDAITAPGTIRSVNHFWYDPNPHDWEEEEWYSYYATLTAQFLSTTAISDPIWKFGYPRIMPSSVEIEAGQPLVIDGQLFDVEGPYGGFTSYGQPVNYWLLENLHNILYADGGDAWTQIVRPGNLELHYSADNSGVLLFSDILRHFYYYDASTGYNVQYESKLTYSNALAPVQRLYAAAPPEGTAESVPEVSAAEKAFAAKIGPPPAGSLQWRPPVGP